MPSPFMTVVVLVVLWLIVVVPMVLRRADEQRRDRSVAEWGRSMRALGRRRSSGRRPGAFRGLRPRHRAPLAAAANRRPVPAAQEALMYPPDRSELSEARAQMLTRRRRSLILLAGGSLVFGLLALVMGGALWVLAAPFLLGFAGYLWFLRNQALNDRARREHASSRGSLAAPGGLRRHHRVRSLRRGAGLRRAHRRRRHRAAQHGHRSTSPASTPRSRSRRRRSRRAS